MNVKCEQFEEILERQDAQELAALAAHARECEACALQLRLEQEISAAAPALRKEWNSAGLWPRIERGIEAENKKSKLLSWPRGGSQAWRLAAAAAVLVIVTASAMWLALRPQGSATPDANLPAAVVIDENQRLLNEKAMVEVEKAEAAYKESIERLAALAEPKLKGADSALAASYREKLIVLDAAISEIRAQADGNRFNAHLQRELLEMYQAKQQTLKQLVQEEVR